MNALGEFEAQGIHFVSLHEGVDKSTPSGRIYCLFKDGKLIAGILAAHHVEMQGTSRQRLEAIVGAILEAISEDEEPPLLFCDDESLKPAWAELRKLYRFNAEESEH